MNKSLKKEFKSFLIQGLFSPQTTKSYRISFGTGFLRLVNIYKDIKNKFQIVLFCECKSIFSPGILTLYQAKKLNFQILIQTASLVIKYVTQSQDVLGLKKLKFPGNLQGPLVVSVLKRARGSALLNHVSQGCSHRGTHRKFLYEKLSKRTSLLIISQGYQWLHK